VTSGTRRSTTVPEPSDYGWDMLEQGSQEPEPPIGDARERGPGIGESWDARWPPLLVGGLALVLGLIELGTKSLWFDEAYDAVHATEGWGELLSLAFGYEASQAAYLVMLKSWLAVVPDSEWWTRLPSAISTALAAGLLVVLGTRLVGRRAGLIAGVLLAVNGFVVTWSQQARTYALVLLAVTLSTYLLVRALEPEAGLGRWAGYGIVAALSVYVHFFAGLVIAAHAVAVALARPRARARDVVVAALIICAGAIPALWFVATREEDQISWIAPLSLGGIKQVILEASGSNALLLVLGVAGAAVLWRAPGGVSRSTRALIVGWAAIPLVLAILVSAAKPLLVPRYFIVAVPALALLAAVAIAAIRQRTLAYAALAATLAVGGYRVLDWYRDPSIEGWRDAVAYVEIRRGPNDDVYVHPAGRDEAYRYYAGRAASVSPPTAQAIWVLLGARTGREALEDSRTITRGAYHVNVLHERNGVYVVRGVAGEGR
jgi:mannosyltransferase